MTNEIIVSESRAPATLEQYATDLKVKLEMANILLRGGLIPQHFKTPEAVLTAILYGQEIGFSPMQSLLAVTVIQGKPTLDAGGIKAKIQQAGGRAETIIWNEKTCKLRGVRGEWSEEYEYTWHDAELAGLVSKDNWRRMPKAMLYARCISIVGRNMFADVLKGFYGKEEMLDSLSGPRTEKVEDYVSGDYATLPESTKEGNTAKTYQYRIPGYTTETEAFFSDRGFKHLGGGLFEGPVDLGPKSEQYRVRESSEKVASVAPVRAESISKKGKKKSDGRSEKWADKAPQENLEEWEAESERLMEENKLKLEE